MENDIDGDPYTYIGPCGNGANCINHEIGWSCECIGRVTNYSNHRYRISKIDLYG